MLRWYRKFKERHQSCMAVCRSMKDGDVILKISPDMSMEVLLKGKKPADNDLVPPNLALATTVLAAFAINEISTAGFLAAHMRHEIGKFLAQLNHIKAEEEKPPRPEEGVN